MTTPVAGCRSITRRARLAAAGRRRSRVAVGIAAVSEHVTEGDPVATRRRSVFAMSGGRVDAWGCKAMRRTSSGTWAPPSSRDHRGHLGVVAEEQVVFGSRGVALGMAQGRIGVIGRLGVFGRGDGSRSRDRSSRPPTRTRLSCRPRHAGLNEGVDDGIEPRRVGLRVDALRAAARCRARSCRARRETTAPARGRCRDTSPRRCLELAVASDCVALAVFGLAKPRDNWSGTSSQRQGAPGGFEVGRPARVEGEHHPEQDRSGPELAGTPTPRHQLIEHGRHTEASRIASKAARRVRLLSAAPQERDHLVLRWARGALATMSPSRCEQVMPGHGHEGGEPDRLGTAHEPAGAQPPASRRARSTPPAREEMSGVVTLWRRGSSPPTT